MSHEMPVQVFNREAQLLTHYEHIVNRFIIPVASPLKPIKMNRNVGGSKGV